MNDVSKEVLRVYDKRKFSKTSHPPLVSMATIDDFKKLDIRVGRVLKVTPFPEGKFSTHVLEIDFGEGVGIKKSLARLTPNYSGEKLIGKQVLGVVNFPPRQIGPHQSETLTLGVPDKEGNVVLLQPEREVPIGGRMY